MWQLEIKTNAAKEWVHVGSFDTVSAAAHRMTGVFLEFHVDPELGTERKL